MSHTDTTTVSEKFNAVDTSIAQANSNIASINSSLSGVNESLATKQGILSAGAGIAISGNTISTKVYPSNPNLLDNWYFGNPINQRGQTTYSGITYTIDRWRGWNDTQAALVISDGGIKINQSIYQYFDPSQYKALFGKQMTISILFVDGTLFSNTILPNITEWYSCPVNSKGIECVTYGTNDSDFSNRAQNFFRITISTLGTASEAILAVKLELGSEQTLAHQDANGNWVLNEIPDYREQLRRCQKYFVKFGDSNFFHALGVAIARTSENLSLVLPLPTQMEELVFPSLQLIGSITCRHGDANYVYSTQAVVDALGVGTLLIKITASGLTPGDAYEVFLSSESYLFISEEL